jgi:transcriptional regulator with XRE-family HTH domain
VIGERIKELRKALSLTQTAFGERIGLKQNSVALIEAGRTTSDQTIFAICREFRVNEAWLRTGAGEMFIPSPASVVEELAEEYHLCPEAQAMVEKFITLDPAAQLAVFDYMCAVVDELLGREPDREERLRDELERQLAKEKKGTEKSEA